MEAASNMVSLSTGSFDALSLTPNPWRQPSFASLMIAMESPGTLASCIHLGSCLSKSLIRVSQSVVSSRSADIGCLFRWGRLTSGRSEKLRAARPLSTRNSLRLIRSDIALAFQVLDSRLIELRLDSLCHAAPPQGDTFLIRSTILSRVIEIPNRYTPKR